MNREVIFMFHAQGIPCFKSGYLFKCQALNFKHKHCNLQTTLFVIFSLDFMTRFFPNKNFPNNEKIVIHIESGCDFK